MCLDGYDQSKGCILGWEYQPDGPPGISKCVRPWGDIVDRIHCLKCVATSYVEAGRPYVHTPPGEGTDRPEGGPDARLQVPASTDLPAAADHDGILSFSPSAAAS